MVQEFNVVCCYSCFTYQVEQVKKSNKWVCKVCNERQTLKQVNFTGSAKQSRAVVQQLNMKRHQVQKEHDDIVGSSCEAETSFCDNNNHHDNHCTYDKQQSKWNVFLDTSSGCKSSSESGEEAFRDSLTSSQKRKRSSHPSIERTQTKRKKTKLNRAVNEDTNYHVCDNTLKQHVSPNNNYTQEQSRNEKENCTISVDIGTSKWSHFLKRK